MEILLFLQFNFSEVDPSLDKKYSLEVPKLRIGLNQEAFHIDRSFFEGFEFTAIPDGDMDVRIDIMRYTTHLDAKFFFNGWVILECDRCMEPYRHSMAFEQRIVYTFDEELEFDTDEVILIEEGAPVLHFAQDFYDFIHLEVPLRKVPDAEVHLCAPAVLELLGLNPDGTEREPSPEEEEPVDPRWSTLKKLKDAQDSEQ